MRFDVRPALAERIRAEIGRLRTEPDGHLDAAGRRHACLPLMGTIGFGAFLSPDGVVFGRDEDPLEPGPLRPLRGNAAVAMLAWGVRRHPWLAELMPCRPADGVSCGTCRATGWAAVTDAFGVEDVVCWRCHGAGFLAPPVFGVEAPDARVRPAAYALILDGTRVGVVQENEGLYLPGGGREPGETPEENVARELEEEIGRRAASLRRLADVTEFFHSHVDRCAYEARATFFVVELADELLPGATLELQWIDPHGEGGRLERTSHEWAARRAVTVAAESGEDQGHP